MVSLKEITRDNVVECVRLKVAEGQEHFVAPNVWSLVEAHYEGDLWPRAIYNDQDRMVGFAMYGWEAEKDRWWVVRLMTAAEHQGRGYGRSAMLALLAVMEAIRPGKDVAISYEPENELARKLYASLGFVETGEMDEDEVVAVKPANSGSQTGS